LIQFISDVIALTSANMLGARFWQFFCGIDPSALSHQAVSEVYSSPDNYQSTCRLGS
jgi:hypothetical protein